MSKYKYVNTPTKFELEIGMTLKRMGKKLGVSSATIRNWHRSGMSLREMRDRAKETRAFRGNKILGQLWQNLLQRCYKSYDKRFKYYGGKGIQVLMSKAQLAAIWKRDKAHLMKQPSLDRINSNGHYEQANCRFIEMEQNRILRPTHVFKLKYGIDVKKEAIKRGVCESTIRKWVKSGKLKNSLTETNTLI